MNAMNFAFFAQRQVIAGFKAVSRTLIAFSGRHRIAVRAHINTPVSALQVRPNHVLPACASAAKPLRVLRVMEPNQQRTCVGRMRISGRMADVCAELDRLAAREAALS